MVLKFTGACVRTERFLASSLAWRTVLGLFLLQATWLALSSAYPMAFDEQYHFGLIQLHAGQWLPFFTSQPPTGTYGAAVRDPSYLYHWLMSFPYRVIELFTHDQTIQIILLRLINVALFAYALILYRRLLRRLGLSAALTNVALLIFTLIPVVPLLAATINYDNLLMVVVPWSMLLTLDITESFYARHIPLGRLSVLADVLLLGGLVKYPFLPVLVVATLFLFWQAWRQKLFTGKIWHTAWRSIRERAVWCQIVLAVLFVLSSGLFAERYAVNVVRYHTPVPQCNQVISQDLCLEYGPWARDSLYMAGKAASFRPDVITYAGSWLYGMWYRLFFAIGPAPAYHNSPPLLIIGRMSIGLAVLLGLGIVLRARWLFSGHPERVLLVLVMLGYGAALFADDYSEYVRTAVAVAINGRYWIPFIPFYFVLGGLAWSNILKHVPTGKIAIAALVSAVFLLQGGGTMSYIVRSDDSWYWPNSTIRRINGDIRAGASPFIIGKDLPLPKQS
ncbi:MAG TPA: hypothetical protein VMB52_01935 [Verrucomicrobiae bacterium]|nr:hypothetical protein [Verrucomicrobiae bacterium]